MTSKFLLEKEPVVSLWWCDKALPHLMRWFFWFMILNLWRFHSSILFWFRPLGPKKCFSTQGLQLKRLHFFFGDRCLNLHSVLYLTALARVSQKGPNDNKIVIRERPVLEMHQRHRIWPSQPNGSFTPENGHFWTASRCGSSKGSSYCWYHGNPQRRPPASKA